MAGEDHKSTEGTAPPRNLRRHTAKILLCDEVDAMEVTHEGDPIALAEKRTLSFRDRKIVCGSTPLDEATSAIARLYDQGVPETCRQILAHLPLTVPVVHVAWSGDMVMSAKSFQFGPLEPENVWRNWPADYAIMWRTTGKRT